MKHYFISVLTILCIGSNISSHAFQFQSLVVLKSREYISDVHADSILPKILSFHPLPSAHSSDTSTYKVIHRMRRGDTDDETTRKLDILSTIFRGVDDETTRKLDASLSSISIDSEWGINEEDTSDLAFFKESLIPVLTASLMITGNTVGAGMLVLPELATGPGMGTSASIAVVAYLINLLSGLMIAEIAIKQKVSSGDDVPSSFKKFAEVNLNSSSAANFISGVSIFNNALVMAFNADRAGSLGSSILGISSETMALTWLLGVAALIGTQTFKSLSKVSSLVVSCLFLSFAGLLLPILGQMSTDPFSVLMEPGTSTDLVESSVKFAPVILMSLIYQNIVPTITKLLDYDRVKTASAIILGSLIPLCMYLAWVFASLGGSLDTSTIGSDGPLLTIFSVIAVAGTSIGTTMSMSEEFDSFFKSAAPTSEYCSRQSPEKFVLPSVVMSIGCSWIVSQFFADDLTAALGVAGTFGSPLLYGVIPVIMTYVQMQGNAKDIGTVRLPLISDGSNEFQKKS